MNFQLFGHSPVPPWDPAGAAGEPLLCRPLWAVGAQILHHGLHQRLWRYLCSSAWSTFPSFSLLIFGFAQLFLSLTSLVVIAPVQQQFSPSQVCFPSSTTAVLSGLSPDQLQFHLGARWHWLHQTLRNFLQLLRETTPV